MGYKARPISSEVLLVEMGGGTELDQRFLIAADVHFDNPHCDRALLKRQFDQAREEGAGIMVLGDWFDLMQGRDDPRRARGLIRPEYLIDYLDAVISDSAEFLRPYRDSILFLSEGNHESAVRKRLDTNPIRRLADLIGVPALTYAGWVQFRFQQSGRGRITRNMYFHHGSGGGGEVTRGVIGTNRRAAYLSNVHIVASGHIHESWTLWLPQVGISERGVVRRFEQLHLSTGTYKDEFSPSEGYHVERGRGPKPLGGTMLRFWHDTRSTGRIAYDAYRA